MSTDWKRAMMLTILISLLSVAPLIEANSNGKHNSSSGCSCHSSGSTTPTHDFPSSYTPGQLYSITIGMTGGVSGTQGGFSLSVSSGTLSNAGTNAKIQGSSATHSNSNSRTWTLDWTAPTSGTGSVSVGLAVNAVDGDSAKTGDQYGSTTHTITETVLENTAPTASSLDISPNSPGTLDDLVASYTYFDADGDSESGSEVRWTKGGVSQPTWDDVTTVPASATSKGDSWSFSVSPSDGEDVGTEMVLSAAVVVVNTAPEVDDATITPSDADESDELVADFSFSDADDDAVSAESISWYLNGALVSELSNSTTVSSLATRSGDQWHYVITPFDGEDSGTPTNSTILIIDSSNVEPIAQNPILSAEGTVDTNSPLIATWTFFDSDGHGQTSSQIEWFETGSHVPIHDDENPLPSSATNKGEIWSFRVRVNDGMTWSEWSDSNELTIGNAAPLATSVTILPLEPTSSDDLHLIWEYFDADGDAESSAFVEWFVDGVNIGAHSGKTTISAHDINRGENWTASIIPSDGTDQGEQVVNEGVMVLNSAPVLVSLSLTPANASSLDDLSYSLNVSDTDGDTPFITSVVWYQESSPAYVAGDILPAEQTSVGELWSVELRIEDGQGGLSTFMSEQMEIENLKPVVSISVLPGQAWAGVELTLSGLDSVDPDGMVRAWYWNVNGSEYEGSEVTVGPFTSPVNATLTVIDDEASQSSVTIVLAQEAAPQISGFSVSASGSEVSLSWTESQGANVTYKVFRSFTEITSDSDYTSLEFVEEVNTTSWNGKSLVAGEIHYAVVVSIDGEESMLFSESTSSSVIIKAPAIDLDSHPSHAGGGIILMILMLLAAAAVVALAVMEKMTGGDS